MVNHQSAQPQAPKRVVLIGARGFIGMALRRRLEDEGIAQLALGSVDVNLTEPASVERLVTQLRPEDAVVMLAALTPDKGRDAGTLMRNLAMMQHVCAAIEKTGCAHLTYFSSDAVYNLAVSQVTEDTPASPQDLYGAMHYTREIMAKSLAQTPVLVLRPTLVYGVDDTHNAYGPNRFRRAAHKDGKITLFGAGEETRDHIHVDDVAALTVRCLLHKSTGTLNLATGRSISFKELARLVAAQFGKPVEIVETARANPITHRHYDVTHLIKAFPKFRFIPLEEGIARAHREMSARG
ncbi:MAG: NAD(P)-dependent oxidoreductase [Betaproteobacteria bacterium]|nr:NAD(P)-dependent oxidoreductase [Betaproteobacteria bacterium]